MKFLYLLLLLISIVYAGHKCEYSKSKIKVKWELVDNGIEIDFTHKDLDDNEWTGIAFGKSTSSSGFLVFENINDQVVVQTGVVKTNGNQTMDSTSQATVLYGYLSKGDKLHASVILPSTFKGINLAACQTWYFIEHGDMSNGKVGPISSKYRGVKTVCPNECD